MYVGRSVKIMLKTLEIWCFKTKYKFSTKSAVFIRLCEWRWPQIWSKICITFLNIRFLEFLTKVKYVATNLFKFWKVGDNHTDATISHPVHPAAYFRLCFRNCFCIIFAAAAALLVCTVPTWFSKVRGHWKQRSVVIGNRSVDIGNPTYFTF